MSSMTTPVTTEDEKVEAMRFDRLVALGIHPGQAIELAALPQSRFDVHDVEALVKSGCEPDLAWRIVL